MSMTIDEAIEHAESKAACTAGACGQEHAELARWLRELRMRRETEDSCGHHQRSDGREQCAKPLKAKETS